MVEDGFPKHPKGDKSTIITLLQSCWSQPFLLLFLLVPEVVRQHLHLARMPNVGASSKKAEIGVKSVQNQLTPTWWWWIWHVLMFSRYQDGSWRIDLELKKRGLERTGVTQCWAEARLWQFFSHPDHTMPQFQSQFTHRSPPWFWSAVKPNWTIVYRSPGFIRVSLSGAQATGGVAATPQLVS